MYRLFLGFIANSWSNQESFHAVEMDEQAMRLIRDWIDQMPENQIGMAMDCFRMTRRQQGRSLANVNAAFRRERHSEPQP